MDLVYGLVVIFVQIVAGTMGFCIGTFIYSWLKKRSDAKRKKDLFLYERLLTYVGGFDVK